MKTRSGLKDVYQNNPHPISEQSMKNFLHMAQVHLSDPKYSEYNRSQDNNDELDDIETLGIEKFKSILKIEARKRLASRFIWGSMSTSDPDEDNVNDVDPDSIIQPDQ